MHKFKLPIGDWSKDRHSVCEWFIFETNCEIEELREFHFKMVAAFPLFESLCSEYEEDKIDHDTFLDICYFLGEETTRKYWKDSGPFHYDITPENFAKFWAACVIKANLSDTIILSMVKEDQIPMLPFYGFDKKNRHIGFMGYGLFLP